MKVINAIYNFIVGDMIILVGIIIAVIILSLIGFVSTFSALKPAIGVILTVSYTHLTLPTNREV